MMNQAVMNCPHPLADLFPVWATTTLIGLYMLQAGAFVWVNDQFQRDTGYDSTALIGRPSLALVHAEDVLLVRTLAVSMLRGERQLPYAYRYQTRSRETRWALEAVVSVTYRGQRAVLGNFMDITLQKQVEAQLSHRAFHDPLTNLPNRALLLDRLSSALRRLDRHPGAVAVCYLDLDNFKAANDAFGHHAGDELLSTVARRLVRAVRQSDTVARLGGDEFAVVLEDLRSQEAALPIARGLLRAVRQPIIVTGRTLKATTSVGVATSASPAVTAEELLRQADGALYRAKARGNAAVVRASQAAAS